MPEHTVEAAQKRARKGYRSADEEQRTKVRAHPSPRFDWLDNLSALFLVVFLFFQPCQNIP